VTELTHGGLTRPVWPSWLAAFQFMYLWLDRIQTERGRMTTRVLRDVVHEMVWRGKWILDDRHAWQIAESADVSPRWVLESLAALERAGIAFRLHMVGVPSQRGLTSNVLIFPGLICYVLDLVPKGARAATIQFLRRSDVRAKLEAGGVWARLPEAVTGVAPTGPQNPALTVLFGYALPVLPGPAQVVRPTSVITGTQVPGTGYTTLQRLSTVAICDRLPDHDRSPCIPLRSSAVEREVEGGAVAPSPHIAPSAASTVPEGPPPPAPPPAAGERQGGPRLIPPSPAAPLVSETRPSTVPPATRGPRVAGSRSEARPTLPAENERAAARRKGRAEPRPEALRGAAVAADGDRLQATLRKSWALVAGDAEFLGRLAALRFASRAWTGALLVVRVAGPPEALEQLMRYRVDLEAAGGRAVGVPVRVAWEAGT
jgi:hypothetical protein